MFVKSWPNDSGVSGSRVPMRPLVAGKGSARNHSQIILHRGAHAMRQEKSPVEDGARSVANAGQAAATMGHLYCTQVLPSCQVRQRAIFCVPASIRRWNYDHL